MGRDLECIPASELLQLQARDLGPSSASGSPGLGIPEGSEQGVHLQAPGLSLFKQSGPSGPSGVLQRESQMQAVEVEATSEGCHRHTCNKILEEIHEE